MEGGVGGAPPKGPLPPHPPAPFGMVGPFLRAMAGLIGHGPPGAAAGPAQLPLDDDDLDTEAGDVAEVTSSRYHSLAARHAILRDPQVRRLAVSG